MTRYKWTIETGSIETPGSAGQVYLELHGLDAGTTAVKLAKLSFDPNGTESGIIGVTGDLGDVQTGSLRSEGSTRINWTVDAVSVMNLTDGRQWTAQGGVFGKDGTFPLLRFEQTGDALDQEPGDAPPSAPDKPDPGKTQEADGGEGSNEDDQASNEDGDVSQPVVNASVLQALVMLQQTVDQVLDVAIQVRTLISDSGAIPGGAPRVAPKPIAFDVNPSGANPRVGATVLRFQTVELFAMKSGQVIPLSQALNCEKEGPCTVSPGASVLVTSDPKEGYGLGGQPGSWAKYVENETPADYGQDPDRGVLGWDGQTAWPIDSSFLTQLFGADWRTSIYG